MTATFQRKTYLLPLLLMCVWAHAQQSNPSYPDFFYSTYPFMLNYDNPAYIVDDNRYNVYAQYKQRLGQFRKVVSYSAQGERIWRPEDKNISSLKVIINNENEGPYISRPRFTGGYATEIKIKNDWKAALGIMLGATAINFSAPNQGATGNSYLPDGKIGMVFKKNQMVMGISALQFLNTRSKVVGSSIVLQRYYNAFMKYKKELSLDWTLETLALADLRGRTITPQLSALVEYRNTIAFGASNRFGYAFSAIGKLHMFGDELPMDLIFMYNTPLFTKNIAREIQSVEIALSLGIR